MKQTRALMGLFLLTLYGEPLNASSCKENGNGKSPTTSPSRIKKLKHYEFANNQVPDTQEDASKKAQMEAAASVLDASRKKPGIRVKRLDLDKLLLKDETILPTERVTTPSDSPVTTERVKTPSDAPESPSDENSALQLDTFEPMTVTQVTSNNIQQTIVVEAATPKSPSSNQISARNGHSPSPSSANNHSPYPVHDSHFPFLCTLPRTVYDRQEEIKRKWQKEHQTNQTSTNNSFTKS